MEIKQGKDCFYIGENEDFAIAIITFVKDNKNAIVINHTFVSEKLRGQGIANELVLKVVEYARLEKFKIIPICSYAAKVLNHNPKFDDVIIK